MNSLITKKKNRRTAIILSIFAIWPISVTFFMTLIIAIGYIFLVDFHPITVAEARSEGELFVEKYVNRKCEFIQNLDVTTVGISEERAPGDRSYFYSTYLINLNSSSFEIGVFIEGYTKFLFFKYPIIEIISSDLHCGESGK